MDQTKYRLARPVINGKPSRTWYVLWREGGRERRRSTRETDKYAAEGWLADFLEAKNKPPRTIDVNWILDRYEADREHAGKRSLDRIRSHLRAVRMQHGPASPEVLGRDTIALTIRRWRLDGVSDGTIRTRLLYLRAALKWAERMKYIDAAPYIPAPPPGAPRERFLTRDEFERLYAAADEQHLRTFLALGVWSGLRNGAMLSLTWADVDFDRLLIQPKGGSKNKKRAIVRINQPLALALGRAWVQRDGPYVIHWNGQPVKSVKRSFHRAARIAGLENVQIHDLRKTCASWLAMSGVPIDRIAMILGDSVAITAKHYAHLSPDYLRDEMEGIA